MRTYTLNNRKFNDFESFIAAKKDFDTIEALMLDAESEGAGLETILEKISERKLRFQSEFGDEYLAEIMGEDFASPKENENVRQNTDKSKSGKKNLWRFFRIVRNTSILFLIALMIGFGVLLTVNIKSEEKGKENFATLREEKQQSTSIETDAPTAVLPEYISLHAQNPDMVGWLSIGLTPIDYPIMYRAGDNDYYLNRNFAGEYDPNGMLILDKRCNSYGDNVNTLIHGHNMKSGLMFGGLRKFMDQGYAYDHRFINFDTLYKKETYEIIAVFLSSVDSENSEDFKYYNYIRIDNERDFNRYINGIKDASVYQTDATAYFGDKLITLSTCDYAKNEGRLVIVGKQVENQ